AVALEQRARNDFAVKTILKGQKSPSARRLNQAFALLRRRKQRAQAGIAVRRHQARARQLAKRALDEARQQAAGADQLAEEGSAAPFQSRLDSKRLGGERLRCLSC